MAMDTKRPPLTFALNTNGVLYHVSDVENGLACGCVCPSCGGRLVAKQNRVQPHRLSESWISQPHFMGQALVSEGKDLILKKKPVGC